MPILKRRYDYTKVYRPNGTLYSTARGSNYIVAISAAMLNFHSEFGRFPMQDKTSIEVIGVTGDWVVDVFEITE